MSLQLQITAVVILRVIMQQQQEHSRMEFLMSRFPHKMDAEQQACHIQVTQHWHGQVVSEIVLVGIDSQEVEAVIIVHVLIIYLLTAIHARSQILL